ncbi:DUF3040 domain-containing protein [soil metagenome]
MPLSEEEQRMLRQLEQSLAAEDPDFASTLRGSKLFAKNRRTVFLAAIAFVAGVAMLFFGAVSASTILGIVGFVTMVVSAYFFVIAWRGGIGTDASPVTDKKKRPSKSSGSFVDRMEERWNRRQDSDDY